MLYLRYIKFKAFLSSTRDNRNVRHERRRATNKGCGGGEILEQTLLLWQRRDSSRLNVEDARQINENIAGYFTLLAAWEADHRTAEAAVQLKNSNVSQIRAIAHDPAYEPEFEKENTDCSPASDFLAA
jgi:hypothetical protein